MKVTWLASEVMVGGALCAAGVGLLAAGADAHRSAVPLSVPATAVVPTTQVGMRPTAAPATSSEGSCVLAPSWRPDVLLPSGRSRVIRPKPLTISPCTKPLSP